MLGETVRLVLIQSRRRKRAIAFDNCEHQGAECEMK